MGSQKIITAILGSISRATILPIYRRRVDRFLAALDDPMQLQRQIEQRLVERARRSAYGRENGLQDARSLADALPIAKYATFAPYIDRLIAGERDSLFPDDDPVEALACTTGTTGQPKVLPVTREWLSRYRQSWEIWGARAILDHPNIIGSYWLQLTGPRNVLRATDGSNVGMISAITAERQNPIIRSFYMPPTKVADIVDPDLRHYMTLRQSIPGNISLIATSTAANLIGLAEAGDHFKEHLIRDLFDGTFHMAAQAGTEAMDLWGHTLTRRNRARARELQKIADSTETLLPKDYWNVAMLACWVGGTVGNQSARLGRFYGNVPIRDIGYLSTEGRHTIPLSDGRTGGVIDPRTSYYEFLPIESREGGEDRSLTVAELENGAAYSVIVSTFNGLYRYRLDDIVRCIGRVSSTPILEFLQKSDQYSDMEGEKLSAHQVSDAQRTACDAIGRNDIDVCLLAVRPEAGLPYYAMLSERLQMLSHPQILQFIAAMDSALRESNIMYRLKRQDGSLASLASWPLKPGTWNRHISIVGRQRGTYETQNKSPVLLTCGSWPEGLELANPESGYTKNRRSAEM